MSGVTDAIAVAAGLFHTCALRSTGVVVCWGLNDAGQLGDVSTSNRNAPVQVAGLTNAIDIAAGASHTCALRANGRVRCWGRNVEGQLGNGTFVDQLEHDEVNDLENVKALSAGWFHTCGVRADATTACWGDNSSGQLGSLAPGNANEPVPVENLALDVLTIAAGNAHSCVQRVNGSMRCWGFNDAGQLGGAPLNAIAQATDVRFVVGRSPAVTINATGGGSTVGSATCAVRATGAAVCWGDDTLGAITGTAGDEFVTNPTGPAAASAGIANVNAAGFANSCALTVVGTVMCWGWNEFGQVGNGEAGFTRVLPTVVPNLDQVVAIAGGSHSMCALRANGTVHCWGRGNSGQLGNGTEDRLAPVQVVDLTNVKAITAMHVSYCAVRANGSVRCWGSNTSGGLGNNLTSSGPNHSGVTGLNDARSVSGGVHHACAIRATGGTVVCWGRNSRGHLGNGGTADSPVPVAIATQVRTSLQTVVQQTITAREIGLGSNHSCAVTGTQTLCWGSNLLLQIGLNNLPNSEVHVIPTVVQLPTGEPVARGRTVVTGRDFVTCALRPDGVPFCWGNPRGADGPVSVPFEVPSFRVNIAPQAGFAGGSSTTRVTVTANCNAGQQLEIDVVLAQGTVEGSGHFSGRCQDGLAEYRVTVPSGGPSGFVAGPATARATVEIRDQGEVVGTQTWQRTIQIVP